MKEECKGGKDYWLARDIQKSSSNCLFEASLGTVLLLQDHEYEGRKINSIFDFLWWPITIIFQYKHEWSFGGRETRKHLVLPSKCHNLVCFLPQYCESFVFSVAWTFPRGHQKPLSPSSGLLCNTQDYRIFLSAHRTEQNIKTLTVSQYQISIITCCS